MTQDGIRGSAIRAHQTGDISKAVNLYGAYLAKAPDDAAIWSNFGAALRTQKQFGAALRAQRRAVEIDPKNIGLKNNLANVLSDIGRYDESIALRREIIAEDPQSTAVQLGMIGRCLRGSGDYNAAIAHLEAALGEYPKVTELQMQLAFAYLANRKYLPGLAAYDARWQTDEIRQRDHKVPKWAGEDIRGKTITVFPEQGYGDAVQFLRFLPSLQSTGANVRLAAEKPMLRLLQGVLGADEVTPLDIAEEGADCWTSMVDLATLHFAADASVPPPMQLNVPDDARRHATRLIVSDRPNYKIGIVWTGSSTYRGNYFRSLPHDAFHPICDIPNVKLYSLYKGPSLNAFYSDASHAAIADIGSHDRDFADCAAAIQEMDLIITSDTVTAHIAASLGCKTWVLLHWDPFWVWGHSGETTDWYPSARLYRQETPLDWSNVMQTIQIAVKEEMRDEK